MTATQLTMPLPIVHPARPPSVTGAAGQVALRALRKYFRTPGLCIMGIVQSALFLFSFRYVFGGAIHAGSTSYVDFLVPSYVATIVLFTGGGVAVAVAEDKAQGFTDRLLSLPVPRYSLVLGRTLADSATNLWSIVTTAAFGFLFGSGYPAAGRRDLLRSASAPCTGWCSQSYSSSWACSRRTHRRPRACH